MPRPGVPESNGQGAHRATRRRARAHDRRAVRRALAAGAGTGLVVGGVLGVGLAPGGGRIVAAGVLLGIATGALVASLWALVGVGLDVLAGQRPGRRRLAWCAALVVFALLASGLALGAGVQR